MKGTALFHILIFLVVEFLTMVEKEQIVSRLANYLKKEATFVFVAPTLTSIQVHQRVIFGRKVRRILHKIPRNLIEQFPNLLARLTGRVEQGSLTFLGESPHYTSVNSGRVSSILAVAEIVLEFIHFGGTEVDAAEPFVFVDLVLPELHFGPGFTTRDVKAENGGTGTPIVQSTHGLVALTASRVPDTHDQGPWGTVHVDLKLGTKTADYRGKTLN